MLSVRSCLRIAREARNPGVWLLDIAAGIVVFLLAGLLIAPLFGMEYLANWGSIDSTFIADARYLAQHWPHPRWQPLWYCGTRFDYIYPPALRYATASIAMLLGVSTARAYHLYTAVLYCTGIAGVYALVRTASASRLWAIVGAAAAAVLSPAFLMLPSFREDAVLHMPQRLNVLVKWGEGPHISALSLLPFALVFSWRAVCGGAPVSPVIAAVFCTLVVAHNFYGATALALLYCLLVWSIWITHRDRTIFVRAFWIVLLAYGMSAFWLTPSYLRLTIDNLKLVAQPGNTWSQGVALMAAILFAAASWRIAQKRQCRAYAVFLSGAALLFSAVVVGHYYGGFRVAGEPHRFVPELDLVLILGAVEALRRLASIGKWQGRVAAAVLVMTAFAAGYEYLARPWSVFVADPYFANRVEFRMSEWISRNLPQARIFATGSLRLWYNAWHDGAQVGGGSEQGLLNGTLVLTQWQVTKDTFAGRDIAWLQAVGADAIVVPEPESDALLLEYAAPRKFAGVLPALYDDGKGNVIYKVPRKFASHARIVKTAEAESLPSSPFSNENEFDVKAYAATLEKGPDRPVEMRRDAPEVILLRAQLQEGESVVVQESYDPAWRAYCGHQAVPIRKDVAGFMRVYPPPGLQEVRMVFELPLENVVGRILTGVSVLIAGTIILGIIRQMRSIAMDSIVEML